MEDVMVDGRLLLRPTEAAERLGLSRARLYELLASRQIGSVKIGASRRVPVTELEAFVERLAIEGRERDVGLESMYSGLTASTKVRR